jgi:hypothetical protein
MQDRKWNVFKGSCCGVLQQQRPRTCRGRHLPLILLLLPLLLLLLLGPVMMAAAAAAAVGIPGVT